MNSTITHVAHPDRAQRQRCKVCWGADGFDFHVPEAVWESVVPEHLRNRVVCLRCFADLAIERDIRYADHIEMLWFADGLTFRRVDGALG